MSRRALAGVVAAVAMLGAVAAAACGGGSDEEPPRGWLQADVPASLAADVNTVLQRPGRNQCQGASMLALPSQGVLRQYVKDPQGVVATEPRPAPFEAVRSLPEGAAYTGWNNGNDELWVAADRSALFIGHDDQWDRWAVLPDGADC